MRLPKKHRILIIAVVGILIIFSLNLCQKGIKNIFYLISSPMQKIMWQTGQTFSNFGQTMFEIKNLKRDITDLGLKNQQLLAEVASLKELQKENEILREALDIGLKKDFSLVLVEVIGKDALGDFILINKGSTDGILKDLPVINQQKILFGKIYEVYENFSKVMLISHKDNIFDVKIQDSDLLADQEIYGVVKGEGNLKIFFDLIPPEVKMEVGDILVTSALEGVFPKGILVGKIKKARKSDIKPFQQAEIEPFFDITQTENLFVITNF